MSMLQNADSNKTTKLTEADTFPFYAQVRMNLHALYLHTLPTALPHVHHTSCATYQLHFDAILPIAWPHILI